jgi:transposase
VPSILAEIDRNGSLSYDLRMPSIFKKTIRGKPYYYARECKRINGVPKIVWQKYLGRAEDIIAAVTLPATSRCSQPHEALVTELGASAALYDMAQRLRLVEFIDRHVPKKGHAPSVGTYLLVAAINRCVAPRSKVRIADWFEQTVLRRLVNVRAKQLTSQRFWDNMNLVPLKAIAAIERDLTAHVVHAFALDVRQVLFDATNFFTFIDTFNEHCTIAQRGKSKEGRASLRIVGLALLVSADFHVPLCHQTYPGNRPDAPTFASLTEELVTRHRLIANQVERVTLIFDKGNNSKDNLQAIADSPYHFIGSLVPTQHPDLLKIPAHRFRSLADEGLPGVTAYRTTRMIFGAQRTVVVSYNEALFVAQARTLLREIAKRQRRLRELQSKLNQRHSGQVHGGKPPTVAGTQKTVQHWLAARHMKELFHVEVTSAKGLPVLKYRFRRRAWQKLQKTLLGKTILFTDNDDWTEAAIVRGYRSQHHVETAFRTMKNPQFLSLRPQRHWTDQKIQVHVFYCVLALMLCSLLRRELHQKGIDRSIPELMEELSTIREVGIIYPAEGKQRLPIIQTTLSRLSEDQRALYQALDLKRYHEAAQVIQKNAVNS